MKWASRKVGCLGYLQPQDGVLPGKKQQSCLCRLWGGGTWFTLSAVEGRSVAGTRAAWLLQGLIPSGSATWPSQLLSCKAVSLLAWSMNKVLSFCLKQTKTQTKTPYIAALLLPSFIAAFVFWIDYLSWVWQAGCFCWKGFYLECDLVFTSRWTVSSCPWATLACGSWPKGLVIWGCLSGCWQVPLQHRSTHPTPQVSRSSGCIHKAVRFPSSMDWREIIKQ